MGLVTDRFGTSEDHERLRSLESRHSSTVDFLASLGADDNHPGLAYHRKLLGQVQQELRQFGTEAREARQQTVADAGGGPRLREPIEDTISKRAWKNLAAGPDADDDDGD